MGYIEKTNYLKETKSILKENLIDLGEEITQNTPFRNYNNAIDNIYNQMPKVTNEGSNISLLNTRKGKVITTPEGNTSQETTRGVNQFDHYNYPISQTRDGVTITNNGDGSFTLNGTCNADSTGGTILGLVSELQNLVSNNTITHSLYYVSGSCTKVSTSEARTIIRLNYNDPASRIPLQELESSKIISKTMLQTSRTDGWSWMIFLGKGDSFDNFTVKYQLEIGDEATPWEPYTGGQASPNPDYPQDIKVATGKNKVKIDDNKNYFKAKWYNGSIGSNGYDIDDSKAIRTSRNEVLNNQKYTVSFSSSTAITQFWVYYYNDTTFLSRVMLNISDKIIFITPDNANFVRFRLTSNQNINTNIIENFILKEPKEFELDLTGKNKFDINNITENTFINEQGQTGSSQVTDLSDFIKIIDNNKYTLSYDYTTLLNSNIRSIVYYDENKNFISGRSYSPVYKTLTVTTPNNAQYLRFSYDKNCYNILLEESPTATPYEPYYNYELCKIDTYKDLIFKNEPNNPNYNAELDVGAWYKYGRIRKFTEAIDSIILSSGKYRVRLFNKNDLHDMQTSTNKYVLAKAKNAICSSSDSTSSVRYNYGWGGIAILYSLEDSNKIGNFTTTEELTNWFNANETVYCIINLDYDYIDYTKITETTLINQLEELNKYIGQGGTLIIETESEEENAQLIVNASALKDWTKE